MTCAVCVAHEGLQEREEACAGKVSGSHIAWRRHDKVVTVVRMLENTIAIKNCLKIPREHALNHVDLANSLSVALIKVSNRSITITTPLKIMNTT